MSYDSLSHTVTALGGVFSDYLGKELRSRGPDGPFHAIRLMARGGHEGVKYFFNVLSTYPRGSDAWLEAVRQFTRFMGNGTATPGHVSVLLHEAQEILARGVNVNPSATFPHAPRTMMEILHSVLPNLRRFDHMEGISESLSRVEGLLSEANESLSACARYQSDGLYRAFVQLRNGIQTTQNVRPLATGSAAAGATTIGVAMQIGKIGVGVLASAGATGVAVVVGAVLAAGSAGVSVGCGINAAIGEPCLGDWHIDPTLSEKRAGITMAVEAEKGKYRICEPFRNGTLCRD